MSGQMDLRRVLTPGILRGLMRYRDVGEIRIATVGSIDANGDPVMTTEPGVEEDRDAWVHVTDLLSERPEIVRQYIPAGILFSKPVTGDRAMFIRPGDGNGPGVPWLLSGDTGTPERWPSWYGSRDGILAPRHLRLESLGGDVELQPKSDGKIKLGKDATRGVARVNDTTANGTVSFSAAANALTVSYTPPGGTPQTVVIGFAIVGPNVVVSIVPGTTSHSLVGKIDSASSKVESE